MLRPIVLWRLSTARVDSKAYGALYSRCTWMSYTDQCQNEVKLFKNFLFPLGLHLLWKTSRCIRMNSNPSLSQILHIFGLWIMDVCNPQCIQLQIEALIEKSECNKYPIKMSLFEMANTLCICKSCLRKAYLCWWQHILISLWKNIEGQLSITVKLGIISCIFNGLVVVRLHF